ncbi:MAG: L-rhamnose/proton symporter RhaT [Terriglobia bacterium]
METSSYLNGILLILLGGIMEGAFALPLKLTPKWKWENIWGAGSLMALLLIPWPVALLTIPNLAEVYKNSSLHSILMAVLFGAGWGMGGVFFGLGISMVGLSLGLSLIFGLIAINGSLIPLLMEHPEQLTKPSGFVVLGGIAVMIAGLIVCALAGKKKELDQSSEALQKAEQAPSKATFSKGLLFCVAAGVLSALVNFGLIFGTQVTNQAIQQGASPANASNAVWALVFTANFLVNVGYCIFLLRRNGTGALFRESGTAWYWGAAAIMGIVWAGGIIVYGAGAFLLGHLGAYIGFPMMLIASILTGNVLGFLNGEWKETSRTSLRLMAGGVGLLIAAILLLGYANTLSG